MPARVAHRQQAFSRHIMHHDRHSRWNHTVGFIDKKQRMHKAPLSSPRGVEEKIYHSDKRAEMKEKIFNDMIKRLQLTPKKEAAMNHETRFIIPATPANTNIIIAGYQRTHACLSEVLEEIHCVFAHSEPVDLHDVSLC